MEQFDIYDINRQKTPRKGIRGEKTASGDMRLVVHICIFNSKGQMLIQHRQPFKKGWSGLWDISVGGSAIAGDDIFNLVRENYEDENGKYEYDLSYFFNGTLSEDMYTDDGRAVIRTNTIGRQLTTQYPSPEETARCGIMEDFGERNQAVLEMWSQVKSNNISVFSYVMMAFLALIAIFMLVSSIKRKLKKKRRMRR